MHKDQQRVTHIVSGDLWGGAEAFVHALACEQQRQNPGSVSCVVMNPGRLADELSRSGLETLVLDESRASTMELARSTAQHIRLFRPDIVHSHREKENFIALLATAQNRRIRRVTTVHGLPEPVRGRRKIRSSLKGLLNDAVVKFGFDAVVGVSHDIASRMQHRRGRALVIAIHNGVPVSATTNSQPSAVSRDLHLLALGRLVPIKRFDRLKEVYALLSRSSIGSVRITLAGTGPLEDELKHLFGTETHVQMPGFVADTARLIDEADALIVTSDHEGIPMSVLEALARGTPVFAFNVGGLPEIGAPTVPLYLAPPGDIETLASEIIRFFSQHSRGMRAPLPTNWSFDIRVCASRYRDLYAQLRPAGRSNE